MRTLLVVAFLASSAHATSRYQVVNKGDTVEVKQLPDIEAPPPAPQKRPDVGYFTGVPPVVIASTWTDADLVQAWISAVRDSDRARLLARVAEVKPRGVTDLRWLLNLYGRDVPAARASVEASLARLGPEDAALAPFFEAMLQQDDPVFQAFGLAGASRAPTDKARALVRALAERPFTVAEPTLDVSPAAANRWFLEFSALRVLVDWDGARALPVLAKRADEAPAAAELIATRLWPEAFDRLVAWSDSGRASNRAKASRAWSAPVARSLLVPTREKLWGVLLGKRHAFETRHRAAVKLGFCAEAPDVDRLLAERGRASAQARPLFDAALFASRSPKAIPLLTDYVRTAAEPAARAGALFQLREMLPPDGYRALLEWVVAHDADAENSADAAAQLKGARAPVGP